jgi:hypothetical protein
MIIKELDMEGNSSKVSLKLIKENNQGDHMPKIFSYQHPPVRAKVRIYQERCFVLKYKSSSFKKGR